MYSQIDWTMDLFIDMYIYIYMCMSTYMYMLMCIYTMPQKIKPIRIQESRCIFDGITPNLPIVHCDLIPAKSLYAATSLFYFMCLIFFKPPRSGIFLGFSVYKTQLFNDVNFLTGILCIFA